MGLSWIYHWSCWGNAVWLAYRINPASSFPGAIFSRGTSRFSTIFSVHYVINGPFPRLTRIVNRFQYPEKVRHGFYISLKKKQLFLVSILDDQRDLKSHGPNERLFHFVPGFGVKGMSTWAISVQCACGVGCRVVLKKKVC